MRANQHSPSARKLRGLVPHQQWLPNEAGFHPRIASPSAACSPSTFTNLRLYGAEILSLIVETVSNLARTMPSAYTFHHPTLSVKNASFCNVTLPISNWNERLHAVGGGRWVAGRSQLSEMVMIAALSQGYATVTADAGLGDAEDPSSWAAVFSSAYWPHLLMHQLGQYLHPCEFTNLAHAAIEDVDACHFDPFNVVGNTIECSERKQLVLGRAAVTVVKATWSGPRASDGRFLCCDAFFHVDTTTQEDLDNIYHMGVSEYNSMLGTTDLDFSAFRNAGGKLLIFHDLEDQIIPPRGTGRYYRSVAPRIPDVDNFYRHFEIPGLGHCFGGNNTTPRTSFELLRAWVENGTRPETVPVSFADASNQLFSRPLCPFPQKAHFGGGDPTKENRFSCRL
ncbi:tannase and feruloyl esterase-domain-containing protein [Dactylonectria estremocensis]|uniref:Carboxylic ester hydrolase n=1 Tax=Dactylonectria estremocensis TaxID=1079267 RepID=A0A9P9IN56_9HYPO|nr:tannase and feruloyl esterase-domain-containing protein [Dactylonectria estremocensis]